MIKKIKVEQLKPGMVIHDFDCSWLQHPFLGNSTKVKDGKTIEKIINCGIREIYIDTDKGLDVPDASTKGEADKKIQAEINKVAKTNLGKSKHVPLKEEIVKAREIKKEAKQAVQNIMEEVRFGKPIETEKVEHVVEKMIGSIFRNKDALISLGRIKKIDEYTYLHSMSVSVLMISFGKHIDFDYKLIKAIGIGGLLHDIGKIKIPPEILTKTVQLSDTEFTKIKEHVVHSRIILEQTKGLSDTSIQVAAQHHERLDGKGYPDNLKNGEISLYGQMSAIVDVYDAMTSNRCYQIKFQPTETLRRLYEWSNSYNRDLVQQFICCVGIYPVGTLVRLESGLLGVVLNHGERSLLHPVVRVVYDTKKERYISPHDIDLSQPSDNGGEDKIENYESPDKWGISPEMYL